MQSREMRVALGRLMRASPWLAQALGRLTPELREDAAPPWTDGTRFGYPEGMDAETLARALAHSTAHCLLGHVFDRRTDALAADMAAALLVDRALPDFCGAREDALFLLAKHRLSGVPLANIAGAMAADGFFTDHAAALAALLRVDDHGYWASERPYVARGGAAEGWGALWRRFGSRLEGSRRGRLPGESSRRASPLTPPNRDYRALLQRYAVPREEPREDPDCFEYGMYAYGLERYGNMPLIEPAECREASRIDELAIVIDTSESCIESLTARFLGETRAMLADEELFARRFNLHVIQCDAKVQRDDHITCARDFGRYIETLRIVGGGGTDYRPAFERIDRLVARGAYRRLPAALFLTDGMGLFPSSPPDYEAVFVFYRGHYDAIDVPSWVRTLVLEGEA